MMDEGSEFLTGAEAEAKVARDRAEADALRAAVEATNAFKAALLPRAKRALGELMGDSAAGMSKFRMFLAIEKRLMVSKPEIWQVLNHFSPPELVSIMTGRTVTAVCDEMDEYDNAFAASLGRRPRKGE